MLMIGTKQFYYNYKIKIQQIFQDKTNSEMMATFGLSEKFYFFYFRKGNSVAKVFVVANENIQVEQAYQIAEKAGKLLK